MTKRIGREQIFNRDEGRCVYCGRVFPPSELTVDHVEPRVKGGDGSAGNLVTCCRPCNDLKGGRPAWAFLAERPELRENFLRYARTVWPRLLRAIAEAAQKPRPAASKKRRDWASRRRFV